MSRRNEQVAAYFAAHASRLERLVRARVLASDATIEDACGYAWCQLVRRSDITLDDRAAGWLYRVAVHEGWRLAALECATVSYSRGLDDLKRGEAGELDLVSTNTVENLVATRLQLERVYSLCERERRALLLRAVGLSYAEIADHTGDSVRTVDRLLRRARQAIRVISVEALPAREYGALTSVARGASVEETAAELGVTAVTVREYLRSARRRLGATTTAEAYRACAGS